MKDASEEMTIADAGVDEIEILVYLNKHVHDWHVAHYSDIFRHDDDNALRDYFTKSLENPACYHYLAYKGTDVVGFIQTELRTFAGSPFRKPSRLIYINIIGVLSEYQGMGIGKLLVNRVQRLAEELQVSRIELDHWEGNELASHFLLKMGFTPYRHCLYRNQ